MKNFIDNYFENLKTTLNNLDNKSIIDLISLLREFSGNIYIMGNGGSASTASHVTCDFNKGLSTNFNMICLNDNLPSLLAYSNDLGFENIYVEQLKKILKDDDILIGISCSGNSENIIKAIKYANEIHTKTVGFTGFDGGQLKNIVDIYIHADSNNIQIVEDVHLSIFHMIFNALK